VTRRKRAVPAAERVLGLFTEVRPGEGPIGLTMLASVFLILAAYYFVKPARDGLLAASGISGISDTELKAYSSLGQSLVLLFAIPLYDRLATRLGRRTLVTSVTLFFASNLVLFWSMQPGLLIEEPRWTGIVFYLWVGIFNVFIVAQFWSFAADLYSDEAGRRLFPLIAVGATAGAATGAWLAKTLVEPVGTYGLLLLAAGILVASLAALRFADRRAGGGDDPARGGGRDASGGFSLVFRHRYLIALAAMILLVNWVNTNGENILFGAVESALERQATAQALQGEQATAFLRDQTTEFYGGLFFWVNIVALVLQAFAASRVLKYGGVGAIVLVLPVVALLSYTMMAVFPFLYVIRTMKIAENATDYSLNNTAKQVLWLPTTTAMKYKAKAAIDTVFVRAGDVLAALTAFVGVSLLQATPRTLFAFNAMLVVVWLGIASIVIRDHAALAARRKGSA
jgi:ATP:ADP antiporter, AAA family